VGPTAIFELPRAPSAFFSAFKTPSFVVITKVLKKSRRGKTNPERQVKKCAGGGKIQFLPRGTFFSSGRAELNLSCKLVLSRFLAFHRQIVTILKMDDPFKIPLGHGSHVGVRGRTDRGGRRPPRPRRPRVRRGYRLHNRSRPAMEIEDRALNAAGAQEDDAADLEDARESGRIASEAINKHL